MKSPAHSHSQEVPLQDSQPGCLLQSQRGGGGWVKEEEQMVGHTCASLLPCLLTGTLSQQPTGQLAAINEQAGKERDLSGVGQLQLKSHAGFLGSPSWEILPGHGCQLGTSGHTSPFISDFGTSSHSLLHSQAKSSNDHDQAQQRHLWSTPQSPMTSLGTSTRKPTQHTEPTLATGDRYQKQRELRTCSL